MHHLHARLCNTHQGYGYDSFRQRVTYVDLCKPCAEERLAAAAKQAEEARAPYFYIHSEAARKDLLANGVPPVNLYMIRQVYEQPKGLFGSGGGYVTKSTLRGRGWIVGMFKWRYDRNRKGSGESDYVVGDRLTALLDETPNAMNHDGLTYVQPCEGGYEDLGRVGPDSFQGDWQSGYLWKDVAEAVRRLITEAK